VHFAPAWHPADAKRKQVPEAALMKPRWIVTLVATLILAGGVRAQTPAWHFHWKQGQVLTYRIEHVTKATEAVGRDRFEVSSKLNLVKRWQVQGIDDKGVATLQMSVVAMRNEQIRPNGDVLLFDSTHPDKSTPGLKEQMAKYVGKTLAVLRVDGQGKVVEVIKGSAAQFESDPPLSLRLPQGTPVPGQSWERLYQITLEPPYGTGEKYKGTQRCTVTKIADGLALIQLATKLQMPDNVSERVPLLQKQPHGTIVFNVNAGRVQRAEMHVDETLQGHQGENSSYHFQSVYREEFVESPGLRFAPAGSCNGRETQARLMSAACP
jgi:hypothetical protein